MCPNIWDGNPNMEQIHGSSLILDEEAFFMHEIYIFLLLFHPF